MAKVTVEGRDPKGRFLPRWCYGKCVVFVEGESSWICTECGWIGWLRYEVIEDFGEPVISYKHPRK